MDNNNVSPVPEGVQPDADTQAEGYVSRRGRRLLIAIIIVLLLALIAITALLLNSIMPSRSEIARDEEAGGLTWVKSIYSWGEGADEHLWYPRELCIADDGTIWVVDTNYKEVFGFNPEGQLVKRAGRDVTETVTSYGPVSEGPEGTLYVGEPFLDKVRVFGTDLENLGTFAIPSPMDIDYRDGTMVIGSVAGFALVDPQTGEPLSVIGTRGQGPDEYDSVTGVTIAPDGAIYVVDAYNNRLRAYDPDGASRWSVQTGAPQNKVDVTGAAAMAASQVETVPAGLQLPADVTVDGSGRIVVVDAFDMSIAVFDPESGKFIAKYGKEGRKEGQFLYPSSIDYDPDRDWFAVADTGNGRVQIVRIPGSSPGADALAAARRSLSGPLRACVAPFILLLIAIIAYLIARDRRRKQGEAATQGGPVQSGEQT